MLVVAQCPSHDPPDGGRPCFESAALARSLRRVLVTQGGVFARCRAHSGPARSLWFPSGSLRRAPARQGLCAWPPRRQRVFCSIGVVAAGHGGSVRPGRGAVHANFAKGLI